MASTIDPTKPEDGILAVKADLRDNLQAAKDEIEALQAAALPAGGSTGQRLTKLSGADFDAGWQTPSAMATSTPVGFVTPEDYGAVGDGATDNVAAFNAMCSALSGGGAAETKGLWLPPGNVYLSSGASHQISGRDQLVIYGNQCTVKRHPSFTPSGSLEPFIEFFNCNAFKICDLRVDGNRSQITASGEQAHNFRVASYCRDWVLDGCDFIDSCSGDGLLVGSYNSDSKSPTEYPASLPYNGTVTNCRHDNNWRNACTVTYASSIRFRGCSFTNTNGTPPGDGCDIEPITDIEEAPFRRDGAVDISFEGCLFKDNKGKGLAITTGGDDDWDVKNIKVIGCHFENNRKEVESVSAGGGAAIRFRGGHGVTIVGNTFTKHVFAANPSDDDQTRALIWVHFPNSGDVGGLAPAQAAKWVIITDNVFVDNPGASAILQSRKTTTGAGEYRRTNLIFANNMCDCATGMSPGVSTTNEDNGPSMVSCQLDKWVIKNNTFIGDGASSGIEGVRLITSASGEAPSDCIVDDNYFQDLAVGVRVDEGAHYSVSGNVFESIEGSGNEIIVAGGASVSRQVNNIT